MASALTIQYCTVILAGGNWLTNTDGSHMLHVVIQTSR